MKKYFAAIVIAILAAWIMSGAGRGSQVIAGQAQVAAARPEGGAMQPFAATWLGADRSGAGTVRFASSQAGPTPESEMHPLLPVVAWPTAAAEQEIGYIPRGEYGLAGGSVAVAMMAVAPTPVQSQPAASPDVVSAAAIPSNDAPLPDNGQSPAAGANQAQRHPVPGDYNLLGAPSISVAAIEQVLLQYHSPAIGNGQAFYDLGVKYGVDPAFMLAFYVHESAAGTLGAAVATKSVGNIICAGWSGNCIGRFRAYDSYAQAAEDWYQLITGPLYIGGGLTTPDLITPRYAPSSDNNDPNGYAKTVERLVDQWRAWP